MNVEQIQPKEVRVGNILRDNNMLVRVSEVNAAAIRFEPYTFDPRIERTSGNLKRVEITPDLVSAFKFNDESPEGTSTKYYSRDGVQILLFDKNYQYHDRGSVYEGMYYKLGAGGEQTIQEVFHYVHELQNIYFKVTGKELDYFLP